VDWKAISRQLSPDYQVFRITPPPKLVLSGTRTSEDFLLCQAKNQELRPLVLKQLDFLNAWQSKKSYLLWFSMFLTGQALEALNRFFHKNLMIEL